MNSFHGYQKAEAQGERIDWILVRGDVTVDKTEVCNFSEHGQFPSDHFPVVAWLTLGAKPDGPIDLAENRYENQIAFIVNRRATDGRRFVRRGTSRLACQKAPLMTRWAAEVGPTNALPEYPRPQLVPDELAESERTLGLRHHAGGDHQFAGVRWKNSGPLPLESALSGVMTNFDEHCKLWYHREFAVPESWRGQRVRLHFGAVDWHCQIWVNGRFIGQHQGGYDAFTFDITDSLKWNGAEAISVCVTDPAVGEQPRGKLSRKPEGIFYTSASGIWQTVWLEPVAEVCIDV